MSASSQSAIEEQNVEEIDVLVENPFHTARLKPLRKGKKPPKLVAVVHQSGCTGCEVCIAGCPVDSIELVSGPNPDNPGFQQMVEIDLARCIGCQNCSQDCPWETITMYHHDDAFSAWTNETLRSELYVPERKLTDLVGKTPAE
jgi:formate hydrogenlyase subunit 6/NADH:ubiquinone oxidoreductase subunit I